MVAGLRGVREIAADEYLDGSVPLENTREVLRPCVYLWYRPILPEFETMMVELRHVADHLCQLPASAAKED